MIGAMYIYKIFAASDGKLTLIRIYQNKLDLHLLGYYIFYVNCCSLADSYIISVFGKTCKIWCKLHKYPVAFYASHNSCNRLSY